MAAASAGCKSYADRRDVLTRDYFAGRFDSALATTREEYNDSGNKDRLLWLMEAGITLHTKGDYEKSIEVFKEADRIADTTAESVTNIAASFIINDAEKNFRGESYERVLIKFYLAMNYVMLADFENAKRYFRKVNFEQKEMKQGEAAYRQNMMARYLDALVSEYTGNYNDARVQYKSIEELSQSASSVHGDRFVLAMKEGDSGDQTKYAAGAQSVVAYDAALKPVSYGGPARMGELVVINQAGKAAARMSRGKMNRSPVFLSALEGSVRTAAAAKGNATAVAAMVLVIGQAENPIPVYRRYSGAGEAPQEVFINDVNTGPAKVFYSYSDTAIKNFDENYGVIVAKNVTSIAIKFVAAYAAAEGALALGKNKINEQCDKVPVPVVGPMLCRMTVDAGAGAAAGAGVASTIAPDLRAWSLLPDNFQAKRVFLMPGDYQVTFKVPGSAEKTAPIPVKIEAGKPFFVNIRTIQNPVVQ